MVDLCELQGRDPGGGGGGEAARWGRGGLGRIASLCFPGLPTVVKLVDRDTLLREREEKKRVSQPEGTWPGVC